jgi:methyl-accepting chemotaxis protein
MVARPKRPGGWTIRAKLIALMILMCTAVAALSAAAVRGAQEMADAGASLYRDALPAFEHGSRLTILLERERGLVARAPAEMDLGRQAEFRKEFAANLDKIAVTLGDIATTATAEAQTTLKAIEGGVADMRKAAEKVFKFSESFAQEQANEVLNGDYAAIEAKIDKDIRTVFERSRQTAAEAAGTLADAYQLLLTIVLVTAGVAIAIVLGVGVMTVRNVTARIGRLTAAMSRLAQRDLSVAIAGVEDRDEMGHMARSVLVFKDSMIKADELTAEQQAEQQRKEARQKTVEGHIASFDQSVREALATLTTAATEMRDTAASMAATAEQTQRQMGTVAAASEQTSSNVQAVAASSEEMSISISEIGRQVEQASRIARQAVDDTQRTNATVTAMADAAEKIGEVVKLIQSIAGQTNLLALNATIEAARAGEAGKGFAVVANEVKSLATQTAKATEDIAAQISAIQSVTGEAVSAIRSIGGTIAQISEISTSIASAIEEQGAATQEIARSTQQAARGTEQVSSNIAGVSRAAGETGAAAGRVLGSAEQLGQQCESLRTGVDGFLSKILAA